MTFIMIYNIRRKYTAVGRKEMVLFFYTYAANLVFDILLLSNIISSGSAIYPVIIQCSKVFIILFFFVTL